MNVDEDDHDSEATSAEPAGGKRRNLLILLDGTGNELGRNLSNVLKLYRIAQKNAHQLVYYNPGVGTISRISPWRRWSQRVNGVLGLATGYGLDDDVLVAGSPVVRMQFLVDVQCQCLAVLRADFWQQQGDL